MKKYLVYVDGSSFTEDNVFKVYIPAKNEKEVRAYVAGNGEVISIKDVTNDYPISLNKISNALVNASFGKPEIDFITRCLSDCGIAD